MNYYRTSSGDKVAKSVVDYRIRQAKQKKLQMQIDEFGYNFCQECGQSSGTYLDCSHNISVDACQRAGKTELAWNVHNITILCRKHHQIKDGLDLKFNN